MVKLSQATALYLTEQRVKGNSEYTVKYYRLSLGKFMLHAGDTDISKITLQTLKDYYLSIADKGLSTVTVQTYIRALRAFLTWCFTEDYIPVNLSDKFRLPKAKRRAIDTLTDTEIKTLFACFNQKTFTGLRNYCLCMLMLDSGLRLNEAVTLDRSCVHIAEGYMIVNGKGNKERIVPIGLMTKKSLLRYSARLPDSPIKTPIFLKNDFTPINRTTVKQIFRKLKTITGIARLKPHLLRHTFATRYLENGGDIYSLQSILGHTSLEMVKRYVHFTHGKTIVNFSKYSPLDNMKHSRT